MSEARRVEITLPRCEPPNWFCASFGDLVGAGIRVAVVDSGWDSELTVRDMRLEVGVAFSNHQTIDPFTSTHDCIGHGTGCTTTLHRMAPSASLCPVRVFGERRVASIEALTSAISWASAEEFDVINLSVAVSGKATRVALAELYNACGRAMARGSVIVAASDLDSDGSFPAAFDNVLSVGAGSVTNPFAYSVRLGERVECLAASGIDGSVVALGGRVVPAEGPSFAAPVVAGIVALLRERFCFAPLLKIRELLADACTIRAKAVRDHSLRNGGGATASKAGKHVVDIADRTNRCVSELSRRSELRD